MTHEPVFCSFCGKSSKDVFFMFVETDKANVCSDCVVFHYECLKSEVRAASRKTQGEKEYQSWFA